MANNTPMRGTPFTQAASGTATALVTVSAVANVTIYVTDIAASTVSGAGTVALLGGAGGTTVLWQAQLGTVPVDADFVTPINVGAGNAAKLQANGTTATYVNISGYTIP